MSSARRGRGASPAPAHAHTHALDGLGPRHEVPRAHAAAHSPREALRDPPTGGKRRGSRAATPAPAPAPSPAPAADAGAGTGLAATAPRPPATGARRGGAASTAARPPRDAAVDAGADVGDSTAAAAAAAAAAAIAAANGAVGSSARRRLDIGGAPAPTPPATPARAGAGKGGASATPAASSPLRLLLAAAAAVALLLAVAAATGFAPQLVALVRSDGGAATVAPPSGAILDGSSAGAEQLAGVFARLSARVEELELAVSHAAAPPAPALATAALPELAELRARLDAADAANATAAAALAELRARVDALAAAPLAPASGENPAASTEDASATASAELSPALASLQSSFSALNATLSRDLEHALHCCETVTANAGAGAGAFADAGPGSGALHAAAADAALALDVDALRAQYADLRRNVSELAAALATLPSAAAAAAAAAAATATAAAATAAAPASAEVSSSGASELAELRARVEEVAAQVALAASTGQSTPGDAVAVETEVARLVEQARAQEERLDAVATRLEGVSATAANANASLHLQGSLLLAMRAAVDANAERLDAAAGAAEAVAELRNASALLERRIVGLRQQLSALRTRQEEAVAARFEQHVEAFGESLAELRVELDFIHGKLAQNGTGVGAVAFAGAGASADTGAGAGAGAGAGVGVEVSDIAASLAELRARVDALEIVPLEPGSSGAGGGAAAPSLAELVAAVQASRAGGAGGAAAGARAELGRAMAGGASTSPPPLASAAVRHVLPSGRRLDGIAGPAAADAGAGADRLALLSDVAALIDLSLATFATGRGVPLQDFALAQSGASVLSALTSATWAGARPTDSAYSALQQDSATCWPMAPAAGGAQGGAAGALGVRLARRLRISAVTIDHLPRALSSLGGAGAGAGALSSFSSSAPRRFSVYALGGETAADAAPAARRLLGHFEYDASDDSPPVQTFHLARPDVAQVVQLIVEDNHGNSAYTCLYRFRVHGTVA
jgi:predicted  nucleic acid-binding Zn-ribbon protein